jgi:hypothetical protein
MLETIDFDVCEAPIVSTAPVNKQLNNRSESPLIENANSKEFADNLSRQGYDNNSIINSTSNGDTDDNSSRLGAIDLDICEVPIVSTAPVNKQLNNESESPIIEIANSKEIDDNSSNRIHNNSIINSISKGDIQGVPVRITQRNHRKNKPKNKTRSTTRHRLGFHPNRSMVWANHLDFVHMVTHGTLV